MGEMLGAQGRSKDIDCCASEHRFLVDRDDMHSDPAFRSTDEGMASVG